MIKRIWKWGIKKFFNWTFIRFVIIGVLNTLIHTGMLYVMYFIYDKAGVLPQETEPFMRTLTANAIAFIVASVFSYFAHNWFTFRNKTTSGKSFIETMIALLIRLLMTEGLTALFVWILKCCGLDTKVWTDYVGPWTALILMIPVGYLLLDVVLGKWHKNEEKEKLNSEAKSTIDENNPNE